MNINKEYSSPHFSRNRKMGVDTIVIHYISAINIDRDNPFNVQKVLDLLTKPIPVGGGKSVRVSAHYAVDRDGVIYELVEPNNVAWHAGKSQMPNGKSYRNSCNEFSIGIELFGGKWVDFTDAQYDALVDLTNHIKSIWEKNVDWEIVGHDTIAPGRKVDPGPRFDWDRYLRALKKSEKFELEPHEEENIAIEVHQKHMKAIESEKKFEKKYRKKNEVKNDVELKDPRDRKENNITEGKHGCCFFRLFGR